MKILVSALAAAFIATVGAGSAAKAAIIDFSAVALCPATCTGITYTGSDLGSSTAVDLDGSSWIVSLVKTGDASGLSAGGGLTLMPTSATYGTLDGPGLDITLTTPIVKTWDGANGPFTETLTTLDSIVRGVDQIGFVLSGTVTGGVFSAAPATMIFSLTQAGGPGNVVSASLTNAAGAVPEPATWVMMALGFIGLGYAAVRRSTKDRRALAI
jgi:PEP-CTERM motif